MTKKNYKVFAEIMAKNYCEECEEMWNAILNDMRDYFIQDNNRFDDWTFREYIKELLEKN